jgi:hypothetical protein
MKPDRYDALEAEILAALRRAPGPEPSAELDARILARSRRRGGGLLRPSRLTAIAATVLVLAGGGVALRLAQQVETVPAALQAPPPAVSADQLDLAAPDAAAVPALADEDDARDASLGPRTTTIDAQAKREMAEARMQLETQRSLEAATARLEAAEVRAAELQQRLSGDALAPATPPPPAPAPPPAPRAEPATKAISEPARMAEAFPAAPAGAALESVTPPGPAEETALGKTQATAAGARLQEQEMADERKDHADTGTQAIAEIRRLLAEGRLDEARARLARLRADDPELLVPADLEMLIEGDAPD